MKQLLTIFLCISLLGCNETKQSIIKTDDELSSNIKLLFEKYENNDFEVSQYYIDDVISRFNNTEITGFENLTAGFKAHHDVLYKNIELKDVYVHTNYFVSGEIWSNAWFTWTGTGRQQVRSTLIEHTLIINYNGKIVVVQGYFDEAIEKMEIAAYTKLKTNN